VKILAFNCGSSTLKFQLTALADENVVFGKERRLAYGTVDRIGTQGRIQFTIPKPPIRCATKESIVVSGERILRIVLACVEILMASPAVFPFRVLLSSCHSGETAD
jgi:acetate kinase